eukprot:scaffold6927_cov93-Cylindrotheca_fusiformis.AAC.2
MTAQHYICDNTKPSTHTDVLLQRLKCATEQASAVFGADVCSGYQRNKPVRKPTSLADIVTEAVALRNQTQLSALAFLRRNDATSSIMDLGNPPSQTNLNNNRAVDSDEHISRTLPRRVSGDFSSDPYQDSRDEKWNDQFLQLKAFKAEHGHCNVPQDFPQNQKLARWVRRQRYQHNHMPKHLSQRRREKLDQIGFVWDAQELLWRTRFQELKEFTLIHGHCDVPYNYSLNRKLPRWVKCQRRQFKLLKEGKPSCMTKERIQLLEGLGLRWVQKRAH